MESLRKAFGTNVVLKDIDLCVHPGQTTVIIGESGCGKSVLLKHIVGLLHPDAGRVYYNGRRIDNLPEREMADIRKDFGFLFQMNALFDSLSAAENVAFPLREHTQKSPAEIGRIVTDKLRMVGLDGGVHAKRPAELSGGQRKRVALARAIALDPKIVLYDEPTTGLDPIRADVINELILRLEHELKVSSIVVTHDMKSAFKVGDRILMLYNGAFIADGDAEEIQRSSDPRVQRFVEGQADEEELGALEAVSKSTENPGEAPAVTVKQRERTQ